jgi:rhamnose transport system permease protein
VSGPAVGRVVKRLLRRPEAAVGLVTITVIAVTTLKSATFLTSGDSRRDLLLAPAMLVLLAIGQTVVIISRNVDLSVGSILGLTAYATGRVFVEYPSLPWPVVLVLAMVVGAVLGLVNGVLVAYGKVPALVITLGTLYIFRGIFLTWAGSDRINASDVPSSFLDLGTQQIVGIPVLAILAAIGLVVVGYYLRTARSGRELYAIGSDPDAAVLYGLKVTRRVLTAFIISGALAGLAGACYVARYGTVSSGAGFGIELQAVGAAVIGGVAIFGGSGTVWGAAIGAVLLITINRALPVIGIQDFWQGAVVGALILAAVVLDRVMADRRERRLAAERGTA